MNNIKQKQFCLYTKNTGHKFLVTNKGTVQLTQRERRQQALIKKDRIRKVVELAKHKKAIRAKLKQKQTVATNTKPTTIQTKTTNIEVKQTIRVIDSITIIERKPITKWVRLGTEFIGKYTVTHFTKGYARVEYLVYQIETKRELEKCRSFL